MSRSAIASRGKTKAEMRKIRKMSPTYKPYSGGKVRSEQRRRAKRRAERRERVKNKVKVKVKVDRRKYRDITVCRIHINGTYEFKQCMNTLNALVRDLDGSKMAKNLSEIHLEPAVLGADPDVRRTYLMMYRWNEGRDASYDTVLMRTAKDEGEAVYYTLPYGEILLCAYDLKRKSTGFTGLEDADRQFIDKHIKIVNERALLIAEAMTLGAKENIIFRR